MVELVIYVDSRSLISKARDLFAKTKVNADARIIEVTGEKQPSCTPNIVRN